MKKILLIAFLLAAAPAVAQNAQPSYALFLARVAVNEAGWEAVQTGDLYAIHEVFARGAARQHISVLSYARHYSQRIAGLRPSTSGRIAWTSNLRDDGGEPANWPRYVSRNVRGVAEITPHPAWGNFRAPWLAVLERARDVATWTVDDIDEWSVCDGEVHDWGSPRLDRHRAESLGLIEVECGETRNDFWARPSLLPSDNGPLEPEVDRD